jgi:UDP-glucose 4-epimerase
MQSKVVQALTHKVEAIIHFAAIVSPYYSVKKPWVVNAVNVTGTMNVLNAALRQKTQKVVFASSSSVYGDQTLLPIAEDNPLHPITPYGASKLSGEKYCEAYNRTYGLNTISLRYFNVYGERQTANPYSGVIAIFSKQLAEGRRPTIYGDGSQTRDFVHVSDVVRANLQALDAGAGAGDAFNVGTGRGIRINELASLLAKLAGKPEVTPTHSPPRAGDIHDSYANNSRAKKFIAFEPKVELEQGLVSLVNFLSHRTAQ